jgi:hypothetical protein
MQGVELIIKAEKVILKQRGIIASDYCRSPSYASTSASRRRLNSLCAICGVAEMTTVDYICYRTRTPPVVDGNLRNQSG